jgi:hypothetical protein
MLASRNILDIQEMTPDAAQRMLESIWLTRL